MVEHPLHHVFFRYDSNYAERQAGAVIGLPFRYVSSNSISAHLADSSPVLFPWNFKIPKAQIPKSQRRFNSQAPFAYTLDNNSEMLDNNKKPSGNLDLGFQWVFGIWTLGLFAEFHKIRHKTGNVSAHLALASHRGT
ncbi:MAG: hypothetical protein JW849_03415 [Phycisphaerae bacterium]|nr:hypothetical protein [Phycisphaerae bacterium]